MRFRVLFVKITNYFFGVVWTIFQPKDFELLKFILFRDVVDLHQMVFKFVIQSFVDGAAWFAALTSSFLLRLSELLVNLFQGHNEELVVVFQEPDLTDFEVPKFLFWEHFGAVSCFELKLDCSIVINEWNVIKVSLAS